MDDYLSKPVEVSTLVGVIERILRRQGASDSTMPVHEEEPPSAPTPKRRRKGVRTSVFDRDTILETLNDDHAAFKELSEMLLADHKPMLEAAGEALVAGNADELASIAHTLKGMVGNFAARDASKAAQAFYAAAHAGRMEKAAAALKRFEQKMAELEEALRADPILAQP